MVEAAHDVRGAFSFYPWPGVVILVKGSASKAHASHLRVPFPALGKGALRDTFRGKGSLMVLLLHGKCSIKGNFRTGQP